MEWFNTIYDNPDLKRWWTDSILDRALNKLKEDENNEIESIPSELLNETMTSLWINVWDDVLLDWEKVWSVSLDDAWYYLVSCEKGKLNKWDKLTINWKYAEVLNDDNMISLTPTMLPEVDIVEDNLYKKIEPIKPKPIDIKIDEPEILSKNFVNLPEISTENIGQQNLTQENIINIWSPNKLSKNQIISFFDSVKNESSINEQQKNLLVLLYIWLTNLWNDWDETNKSFKAFVELQKELNIKDPDWKFWINTFLALKNKFWHNDKSEIKNSNEDVVNKPNNTVEIKNIATDNYSEAWNIINSWIWERELTFNFNWRVSFKVTKDTCILKRDDKSYIFKKTDHNRKFQLNDNYLEFLPTWIYVRWKTNDVLIYKPNWDIFKGELKNNEYKNWKLSYKNGGSFEWTFENWKEKCGIRKIRSSTRLEYNGEINYYLDISKSWEMQYSCKLNYGPIMPYPQIIPLKMDLNKSNDTIKLVGENRTIEINTQTWQWKEIKTSNNYERKLPQERCNLVCEQLNDK